MRFAEIETFRALMRGSSTRKAAALLHVTQPAISQSLKRLEAQAGMLLFQRTGGRLVPTPEARALWIEVERVFIGMDAIEHRVRSLRDFGVSQLELSSFPAYGLGFMPRALARLKAHRGASPWPQVSLQVLSSKDVRDRVAMGISDFGLMADELSLEGIDHSTFSRLPGRGRHAARATRWRASRPSSRSNWSEAPFLSLNPEDPSHQRLEAALMPRTAWRCGCWCRRPTRPACARWRCAAWAWAWSTRSRRSTMPSAGWWCASFSIDVHFTCLLALPAGKVLSATARDFISLMRLQLAEDEKRMQRYLR
jgi:DNA-binding transcriptional LysR family regulator